jgi:hypothetical protein
MSDMHLEVPDADAAEQEHDIQPDTVQDDELDGPEETPLEANEADAADQARSVRLDDDEYR